MSIFISDIDKVITLRVTSLAIDFYEKDSEWCLQELKNKTKVQLGNSKSGHRHIRKQLLTRAFYYKVYVKSCTVQMGFHKCGHN